MDAIPPKSGLASTAVTPQGWFWLIFGGAFLIRLFFVLFIDPTPHLEGGDSQWLLSAGYKLAVDTATEPPSSGPLYLFYVGWLQAIFGLGPALHVIRLLNALFGALLCGFALILGRAYISELAGRFAAICVALNPIFVIETGQILTESVFLLLLFGALVVYAQMTRSTEASQLQARSQWRKAALIGALLGLATLTRAVTLALPVIFFAHLVYHYRRQALRPILILLAAYMLTVSIWSVYTVVRWHKFVFAAEGIAANVYLGATDGWCGPECVDKAVGIAPGDGGDNQSKYAQGAVAAITSDPIGYVRRRLSNLAEALFQPHNTPYYPGESIKGLFSVWWSNGRSLDGLTRIFSAEAFWPKLALYIFHFAALILGLWGMLIGLRRHFWALFPLYSMVGYILALHSVLTAIPRYVFPIEPLLWLFAGFLLFRHRVQTSPVRA